MELGRVQATGLTHLPSPLDQDFVTDSRLLVCLGYFLLNRLGLNFELLGVKSMTVHSGVSVNRLSL